ncbi:hypothetical protein F6V30_00305 [Oryzomonas sagensis]|uniref:Lipoprotein n=1 Tax=Oryzomonas sagensis TaxID=2603857 RepID=A0ABQ6TQJ4_9BACT|nr:hypothetical protein [Oryzomonas sagensis]KAB0671069.1 hypothetical protein F6V30_00305 [Oryzomonas sagensis]
MKTPVWVKTALLLATISMLSGCLGWPYEGGGGGRGNGSISGGRGGGLFHDEHRGGDDGGRR